MHELITINKQCKNNSSVERQSILILSYKTTDKLKPDQIKYLMTILLNVLFSDLSLSNKGLESCDSPDLDDAESSNFR